MPLQLKLWDAIHRFEQSQPPILKLEWERVKADPIWAARELESFAGIAATEQQLHATAAFVEAPERPPA